MRIGIALGDSVVEGGDLYGNGVNVAARLEAVGEPGGIIVSAAIAEQVYGRVDCVLEDIGPVVLKNIPNPVQAFKVCTGAPTVDAPSLRISLPEKPSIVVLPFSNMIGCPDQDYFIDGLADGITQALSCVRSLFVIARNSAFTYKGRAVDVRQVGRELGVRYVLEGGVRKAGNRVRITGQLIEAASGNHIWADQFNGVLEDIFEFQDQIASDVAGAIEPKLQQAEIQRARTKPTDSLTAYDLYLRALGLFHELTEPSLHQALCFLDQATAADPDFAAAYGLAAWCYRLLINYGRNDDDQIRARGVAMAILAVSRGKDDPLALALGGAQIALLGREHDAGLAHIERSLSLNPNSARAWELCGWVSFSLGQHERSIDCFQRAIRLSPRDPLSALSYAGMAWPCFFTGQYEETIAWADKASLEMPNSALPLRPMIAGAALSGRIGKAQDAIRQLRAINPDISIARLMRIDISRPKAQRDLVETALRMAGLPE